ncbi:MULTISPECIES: hypothetical protein [Corallococcus]|uniref:hypothetical protein n=1 Tax=Corallococcus TaxID=83461 RepID=UPI001F339671|nr:MULTISPECIES: hypothetical protein [Corallococcus]
MHTDVTGRIARRFGATPQRPVVTALPLRPLLDVALDNAVEGCVRETYGALVAHYQALHAQDTEVREAMVRIAEDETRHAGLSWDIDQWARSRLSSQERDTLREAQRQAVALLRAEVAVPLDLGSSPPRAFPRLKSPLASWTRWSRSTGPEQTLLPWSTSHERTPMALRLLTVADVPPAGAGRLWP